MTIFTIFLALLVQGLPVLSSIPISSQSFFWATTHRVKYSTFNQSNSSSFINLSRRNSLYKIFHIFVWTKLLKGTSSTSNKLNTTQTITDTSTLCKSIGTSTFVNVWTQYWDTNSTSFSSIHNRVNRISLE